MFLSRNKKKDQYFSAENRILRQMICWPILLLMRIETFSGEATLLKLYLPSEKGSILKEKNLLPFFRVD